MNLSVLVLLIGAVIAVPVFKRLGLGSVLGYLAAGVVVGPYALGLVGDVDAILHFSELGVVLLLFIIGLELKLSRLWSLRRAIFGYGSAQLLVSATLVALLVWSVLGEPISTALLVGLVLALSSTAFALQVLAERGELHHRYGRSAFATLLFQDLAVVPVLALVPVLGSGQSSGFDWQQAALVVGLLIAASTLGSWFLKKLLRIVAQVRVRELLTAMALLTVLGAALAFEAMGLSMALGAFLAGLIFADSEFRHQLEADIEPFKGLLLGLFFMAVGMSMNLALVQAEPLKILALVFVLVAVKFTVLFALGKWQGLDTPSARKLGLVLSQGGEFAFVVFSLSVTHEVLPAATAELWIVVVSLSMLTTPLLFLVHDALLTPVTNDTPYDVPVDDTPRVLIAGFGRFGQIVARVLAAKRIPFTALDISLEQVDFVKQYGNKIYYGDASRMDLLEAAGAESAELFVLAIDDVEASLATAEIVTQQFPHLAIYARARNRKHAYHLMDLGIQHIDRETFMSALTLTQSVLEGLGFSDAKASNSIETFRRMDRERLIAHQHVHNDEQKMQDLAIDAAKELEEMFHQDSQSSVMENSQR